MRQLISGLKFLHDHGIAQNNINTENVMIGFEGTVKIIDCDEACYLDRKPYYTNFPSLPMKNMVNDLEYIDNNDIPILFDNDLWGIGMIFYELANNGNLFDEIYRTEYVVDDTWIKNPVVDDIYFDGTPQQNALINAVIQRALYIPPDPYSLIGRPTVDEIYNMLFTAPVTSQNIQHTKDVQIKRGSDIFNMEIYIGGNTYVEIKNQLIAYANMPQNIQLYAGGLLRSDNSIITDFDFNGSYLIELIQPY